MRSGHIGKALLLVFSVVLLAVLASDASDAESGTCGDGVSWVFDAGTLTISGTGGMTNYDGNGQPWYNHADEIDNIVIEEGIRHIGKRAFVGTHITELFLPDSVRSIGEAAFESCAFLQSVRMGSELASFSSSIFKDSPKLYHIEVSDDNPYIFAHTDIVYMKRNCRPCLIPLGLKFTEIPAGTPSGAFETGEKGSFFGCMDLTRIDVESGNQYYSSYDGVLFTSGYYQMVCVPRAKTGTFTIPDQTIDAQFSFIGSSLSRVILGAGIKDVKEAHLDFASANCINNSLLCLVIGEHVRNLENSSSLNGNFTLLRWCTAIQTVTANGNPVYGAIDGMLYSKESSTLLYVSVASEGVVVPGNIVKIGRYAFRDCIHLEEVVFPDSLKSLEINAFSNCPLLHRIVYGSGLNCTLRYDMFVDCNQLTEFHTDNNTKYYTMEDGAVYRTEGGGKVLSYVPNGLLAFLVTDDVVSIDEYAFRNNVKIQSVNVGAEITKISNYQFYECTSLTSVTLPASLKSIGSYAFYRAGIIEITFPASIEDIGNDAFSRCAYLKSVTFLSNETTLGSRAFYMCSELTTLVLPSNLKNIMVESFYGCSSLGSVSIPDSVKVISRGAFSNCSSIDGICIPSALETLGESAFSGCYSACFLQFSGTNLTSIPDRAFSGCGSQSNGFNLSIPNGIVSIGDSSFSGAKIMSLTVPDSLRSIGEYSFSGCPIAGTLSLSGVREIEMGAFMNVYISNLVLNDGLESIGKYVFQNCDELTDLCLPKTVKSVGSYAFVGCDSLTSVVSLSSLSEMGDSVFSYNRSLVDVSISARTIGSYAFSGDVSLKAVVFTDLESIGEKAFFGCVELTQVILSSELRKMGRDCFTECTSLLDISVPSDNAYFSTDGRSLMFDGGRELIIYYRGNISSSYTIPDTVKTFWDGAFISASHLVSLTCGTSVTSAQMCVENFEGCTILKEISVKEGNTSMRSMDGIVYSKDRSILIYAPPAVTECSMDANSEVIKLRAFYGCSKLVSVRFSAYLTDIGDSAFYGCTSLTSINIQSVSSIGAKAFYGCSSLSRIIISETSTISFGKDCFDLGRDSVTVGSSFESGFLDDYLGKTKANYVSLDVDTRSGVEKARDNTPLIAGGILAASTALIAAEIIIRRRR